MCRAEAVLAMVVRCHGAVGAGERVYFVDSDLIIALENVIVDKVSTVPSSKSRRNDTSAPMRLGWQQKKMDRKV